MVAKIGRIGKRSRFRLTVYVFEAIAMAATLAYSEASAAARAVPSMNTTLLACGSALAATLLVALVFLLGRRSGNAAERRLNAVAAQIDERMQAMVRDLSEALERAQEESRRSRALGELGGTIDLDEVVERTLDVANTMGGVDAVVVAVSAGGESLTAASGLGAVEPASAIVGPPDGSQPRSISVEYDYRPR